MGEPSVKPLRDRLQSEDCAKTLKALADADRLKIIQCLQQGPRNVSQIADLLGVDIANASHHLSVLRHAGLVHDQKQGKYVIYSLDPESFPPQEDGGPCRSIDLGCCRLDLSQPQRDGARDNER